MRPCPSCGSTELTPAGNCQNCGLFRGDEGYGQGHPSTGANRQPPPRQSTYPAQSPYGAGYDDPNAYPSRPSTVPLIVLSVIAVMLAIGIVGVVIMRTADKPAGGTGAGTAAGTGNGAGAGNGTGSGNGTGTTAEGVDKCVVGTWRVTKAKEKVEVQGTLSEFTARGGTVDLKADGTGKIDYGSGVAYTGNVSGNDVVITFIGSVAFSFKTVDGSFTFSDPAPNGSVTVMINGATTTTIPLDMDTEPARYTCDDGELRLSTDLVTTEMSR